MGHDDYEISSHVVLSVFSKNPAITAISYPSRRQYGAINFAVRVETFWDDWALSSVCYGRARHLAMGYFSLSAPQAVNGVHNDGRLDWIEIDDPRATLVLGPPFVPLDPVR